MIEIWTAAASSDVPGELEQCCLRWLTDEERARADRFRVATARNQHVVGRGMARYLLTHRLGPDDSHLPAATNRQPQASIRPDEVVFEFSGYGKPSVASPPAAVRPFNVAHTDGMVLCALRSADPTAVDSRTSRNPSSSDRASPLIGVDVERISRRTDLAIAQRYFARPEVEWVEAQPDHASKLVAFLRIWTLKEAFIKAVGTGLSMPLADFSFQKIDSERPTMQWLRPSLDDGRQWHFATLTPAPGYLAAIAWNASWEPRTELQITRFETLLPHV